MLNFITQSNTEAELKDSVWMFNADFSTFYFDRFDFVRFNDKDEIEYLDAVSYTHLTLPTTPYV